MITLLYDLLYLLPINLIILAVTNQALGLSGIGFEHIIMTLVFAVLVDLFFHSENKLKYLMAGLFFVLMTGLVLLQGQGNRLEFAIKYSWVAVVFLLVLLCELIAFVTSKFKWARRVVLLGLVIMSAVAVYSHFELEKAVVGLIFLQILVYLADEIQLSWVKVKDTDHKEHLVYIGPFLLLTALLVFYSPSTEKPYDWKFAITVWERVCDAAKNVTRYLPGKEINDYSRIDFSQEASVGGSLLNKSKDVFVLETGDKSRSVLYLEGKYFNHFDGRQWTSTITDQAANENHLMDYLESQTAVRSYDREHYSDYIKSASLTLRYQLFNSKYIFLPSKALVYGGKLDRVKYKENEDSIVGIKRIGYGTEYNVKSDRLNTQQEKFGNLMNNLPDITEDSWKDTVKVTIKGYTEDKAYTDYLRYKEKLKQNYTIGIELPYSLKTLLLTVYDGAESDWDKMVKLEKWLNSFDYNASLQALPEDISDANEYLEYFLLTGKEGYCIHFATAMTLLAWSEGLPARLVEGYYVKNTGSNIVVTSDMAHAWTEIYFEDFGWVAFEPTPCFKDESAWTVSDEYAPYEGVKKNEDYVEEAKEEVMEEEPLEQEPQREIPVKLILLIFALCFVFMLISVTGYYILSRHRLNNMPDSSYARLKCRMSLLIISYIGYEIMKDETLEEFYHRLLEQGDIPEKMLDFISNYEAILYSPIETDGRMIKNIELSEAALLDELKGRMGWRRGLYLIALSVRFAALLSDYTNEG